MVILLCAVSFLMVFSLAGLLWVSSECRVLFNDLRASKLSQESQEQIITSLRDRVSLGDIEKEEFKVLLGSQAETILSLDGKLKAKDGELKAKEVELADLRDINMSQITSLIESLSNLKMANGVISSGDVNFDAIPLSVDTVEDVDDEGDDDYDDDVEEEEDDEEDDDYDEYEDDE